MCGNAAQNLLLSQQGSVASPLCLPSRLRRSLREIVEIVTGFKPVTTSTISLKVVPQTGKHEQKDEFLIILGQKKAPGICMRRGLLLKPVKIRMDYGCKNT